MKIREILPKDRLGPIVAERIREIKSAMAALSTHLNRAPKGLLGISSHQGGYQYFHKLPGSSAKGNYIAKDNVGLAKSLAQRDYAQKAMQDLQKNLDALLKFSQKYDVQSLEKMWESLHPARRTLLEPFVLTDEEYQKRWENVEFSGRPFASDAAVLMTACGERVRSKSEVIIADTLFRLGVPYRYEYPHKLHREDAGCGGNIVLFPDFTCLNLRTRKEFIWEHFGLVDNEDYARNMVGKLNLFHANGFFEGENLVFSMETFAKPLSSRDVERLVNRFLL